MTRLVQSTKPGQILFFAASGQRYTHRGSIYRGLQEELPRIFPDQHFVFFDMLRELPLSCPLLWTDEQWAMDPRRRLLTNWGALIQILRDKVMHQLKPGTVLISHGFGLNLLLNAAVTPEFDLRQETIDQVYEAQGGLVKIFLKDIAPPEYLIAKADCMAVIDRMARESPPLAAIDRKIRSRFCGFEEGAIGEYFQRVPNQQTPHFIDGEFDENIIRRRSVEIVEGRILEWRRAAA